MNVLTLSSISVFLLITIKCFILTYVVKKENIDLVLPPDLSPASFCLWNGSTVFTTLWPCKDYSQLIHTVVYDHISILHSLVRFLEFLVVSSSLHFLHCCIFHNLIFQLPHDRIESVISFCSFAFSSPTSAFWNPRSTSSKQDTRALDLVENCHPRSSFHLLPD